MQSLAQPPETDCLRIALPSANDHVDEGPGVTDPATRWLPLKSPKQPDPEKGLEPGWVCAALARGSALSCPLQYAGLSSSCRWQRSQYQYPEALGRGGSGQGSDPSAPSLPQSPHLNITEVAPRHKAVYFRRGPGGTGVTCPPSPGPSLARETCSYLLAP